MRTFQFYQKNGNVTVTLSAENFEEAVQILDVTVLNTYGWRCDDDEGEDEDE
jgi:hypothetical protein